MESSGFWTCVVMKLFKTLWCSRRRRVGRFNVQTANTKNHHHHHHHHSHRNGTSCGVGCSSASQLTGVIRHCGSEVLLAPQNSDLGGYCRSPVERRGSPTGSVTSTQSQSQLTPSRQLSDGERLKKVILELVDTEKTYVKHLNNLLENYLEPLKSAAFLSSAEVNALFGNIREIVAFQRLFLQALQEALDMEPGFHSFDHPYEFKNVLFSIGSAFLYYASQFKLYSSFCASHSKAQKVLHPSEGNQALQEFLASRNPRQQHSATLESYLIKPIQRILKYPLLLQQLKALTTPGSDEHRHLLEALKVMEKVAEHINEMQRIHEEYGAIFDHLFRQHQKSCKQPVDLSPGDLLYYGGVEWLNISDFLGKIKKGLELHAMCFVFKTAVVFLCKERLRQKKKLMVSAGGAPGKNSASEVEIIRYQVLIPVTEVQVRASSMKDMDSHFLWELIHLKSQLQRRSEKVYHLSNSTSEFRNAFLKTIRQIIRESVRNMSIPANKPSSSSSSSSTSGLPSKGNTNTLQPLRSSSSSATKKKSAVGQSSTLQRHSAGNIDYDNVESYDNVPETHQHHHHQQQQQQHHYQGNPQPSQQIHHDLHNNNFRTRSKTVSDAMDELSDSTTKSDGGKEESGTRSEGEEEVMEGKKKATLGRTPNHLSLSTTSTLSTGSTGSMAKLIQSSNQPSQYQPTRSLVNGNGWMRLHDDDDDDDDDPDYTIIDNIDGRWEDPAASSPYIWHPLPHPTQHLIHLTQSSPQHTPRSGPHVTVIYTGGPPSPRLPWAQTTTVTPPTPPPLHATVVSTTHPPTPPRYMHTDMSAHKHYNNTHTPPGYTHIGTHKPNNNSYTLPEYTHTDTHVSIHKPHDSQTHMQAMKIHTHIPQSNDKYTDTAKVHTNRATNGLTQTDTHRIQTHTKPHTSSVHLNTDTYTDNHVPWLNTQTNYIPRVNMHTKSHRDRHNKQRYVNRETASGESTSRGLQWAAFPPTQNGVRERVGMGYMGEDGSSAQGMTIDTLLQQLRALS